MDIRCLCVRPSPLILGTSLPIRACSAHVPTELWKVVLPAAAHRLTHAKSQKLKLCVASCCVSLSTILAGWPTHV